jgi:hypothetical protein
MSTGREGLAALEAAVARDNPGALDAFLATLPEDTRVDMNAPCGCYLHERWAHLVGGGERLAIGYRYATARQSLDNGYLKEIGRVELPNFLTQWQQRCIEQDERLARVAEGERNPDENWIDVATARAFLVQVAEEERQWI